MGNHLNQKKMKIFLLSALTACAMAEPTHCKAGMTIHYYTDTECKVEEDYKHVYTQDAIDKLDAVDGCEFIDGQSIANYCSKYGYERVVYWGRGCPNDRVAAS